MMKNKSAMSLFSTYAHQTNNQPPSSTPSSSSSSSSYHFIDNEYFAAFDNLDEIQEFHKKLIEKQSIINNEKDDNEMDMKTFAEQFLIDSPESISNHNLSEVTTHQVINHSLSIKDYEELNESISINSNSEINQERQRRNIKDLPQSNHILFTSDDDNGNIFDSLTEKKSPARTKRIAYEDMSSILLTLDVEKPKKKKSSLKNKTQETTIGIELAEPSIIKNEPIEHEQLTIMHISETKQEPIEINVIPTVPMSFGTPEYSNHLDDYVQNIHRSCSTNVSISDSPLLRPKRIRKRKKLYIEESESLIRPKRIRKKPTQTNLTPALLTDGEIEQQFGERLPSTVKLENNDENEQNFNKQISIEPQVISAAPIELARAKLINALGRGHGPDTFLLNICSRENKMYDIELAIYSTTQWHLHRTKILTKIEETLRGLRVNWAKIAIRIDHFDVQICTSCPPTPTASSSSLTNMNSSWVLKVLSESRPLIVHIHDRRYPQQRDFIKCPCSQCSSNESSLPIIISVSPVETTTTANSHLSHPTILRSSRQTLKPSISSSYNIHTKFFQALINQYGINTISSVTQCTLDLTLIVSVHSSLSDLCASNDDYEKTYQQIIDPLKYTINNSEHLRVSKYFRQPDALTFYQTIKKHKANIRNAQSMRNIIFDNISRTSNIIFQKQPTNRRCLVVSRFEKSHRNQMLNKIYHTKIKQQAHCTPIIELKPILDESKSNDECHNEKPIRKVTKVISTNTIQKDSQRINMITTQEITPRVIRLSINKSSLPTNSIRLVSTTSSLSFDKTQVLPLVPKQINIVKPISSSITPAIKLANPILISNKFQQPSIN
ncbi:unnamed protein product [Rotaria magnacalcarata]|uniref:Uncharacterized protein n=3 Tax=Rotaria magnacalcarata TaxID=392030 RepID=A0A816NF62_9BILA|nr:unnamed protein product [Rotaria magnacalcarata]CAF4094702.1 unnamed protein product [Rotaria magnacalcarata]